MVPGEIGIIPELREVIGTPPGGIWALMGFSGKEGKGAREGAPPQAQFELGGGLAPTFLPPSFLFLPSPSPNRKGRSPTVGPLLHSFMY